VAQALNWTGGITVAYWIFSLLMLPISLTLTMLPSPAIQHQNPEHATNEPINYRLVGLITLFFFLYVGMEITMGGWISTYALQLHLANEAHAALLASAFWGAFTFGRLIAIPLAFRLRPRTILITDLSGVFLSLILILLWPTSLIAVGIGAMGVGVSVASMFPTMLSFAGRRINITAQVTSIFFFGASIGSMCLPFLMGRIIEHFGPMALPWAIFADLMLAIALFTFLMRYSANVMEK
jgi:fucose permease